MSHTNQTPNYHLPQFIGTDKPAWLVDFNQAMSDIDTQMKANETASGTAEADAQSALSGVTALNSQVGTLQTSVTALETAKPLDEAQIETNRQNIATNAQNIVGIDNRLGHVDISGVGSSVTDAIANEDTKVGDLADLDTTDKSSIVNAINEVAGGGGDTATVRYYNGYIQYTPDNGTTWVNLLSTTTPTQLLPTLTSNNSSPLGVASALGTGSGAIGANEAYLVIDDSSATEGLLNANNDYVQFTFTNPTFITYMTVKARSLSAASELTLDYSEDGVLWNNSASMLTSTDSTPADYTRTINTTVKAIRVRKSTEGSNVYASHLKAFH